MANSPLLNSATDKELVAALVKVMDFRDAGGRMSDGVKRWLGLNLRDAHKRGLLPTIHRMRGDVRNMVRATHELHSKPNLLERALAERLRKKDVPEVP